MEIRLRKASESGEIGSAVGSQSIALFQLTSDLTQVERNPHQRESNNHHRQYRRQ